MADPAASKSLPAAELSPSRSRLLFITFAGVVDLLFDWQERRRQRRKLAAMDEYMLRDIGLSRADVEHETHKPFWQP
jgi:uncharacterized protein YjiS (DUF1127 family)